MTYNVNADVARRPRQDAANRRTSCLPTAGPIIWEPVMKRCTKCGEVKRAYMRAYNQRPEVKAAARARHQTPEYKAAERAHQQTPEYKAAARARHQTPEHKAYDRARQQTPEYKAANRARQQIPEHKAHRQTPEFKAHLRTYMRAYYQTPKGREAIRRRGQKRRALKESNTPPDRMLTREQWDKIFVASKGRCYWCGKKYKPTMDHVLPLSRGGQHVAENVVVACLKCNLKKHAKIITLF